MSAEWTSPQDAAAADFASLKRVQAGLVYALLDLNERIRMEENRATERKLKEEFARVQAITIPLSSLLKAEGVGS